MEAVLVKKSGSKDDVEQTLEGGADNVELRKTVIYLRAVSEMYPRDMKALRRVDGHNRSPASLPPTPGTGAFIPETSMRGS
jgi:hypothetical protein